MFVFWLVRPGSVGGGDWKWLSVLGAALGFLQPSAAPVLMLVACVVQLGHGVVRRRRRDLPFAPALAVGYVGAVSAAIALGAIGV